MDTVRIIETNHPFGGNLAHIYVFCLPRELQECLDEVIDSLRAKAAYGVEQLEADEAGLLVYTRRDTDIIRLCDGVTKLINDVLGAQLEFDRQSSLCFVKDYGDWPGSTSYKSLLQDPHFTLPYMQV